nr:RES family NAD+ phosphorylase [Nitrococcus mobilis]
MSTNDYHSVNYRRTQEIGAAVAFLGCDGLLVPSARWNAENLVLFSENHGVEEHLIVTETQEFDWKVWARRHGFLSD